MPINTTDFLGADISIPVVQDLTSPNTTDVLSTQGVQNALSTVTSHDPLTLGTNQNGLILVNQELQLDLATTTTPGSMSAADKLKLDGLSNLADTDALSEGTTNLYYTEARVNANPSVVANTAKISASGSVVTHSDVTNAGSGAIITAVERTNIGNNVTAIAALQGQAHDPVTVAPSSGLSLTGQQLDTNFFSSKSRGSTNNFVTNYNQSSINIELETFTTTLATDFEDVGDNRSTRVLFNGKALLYASATFRSTNPGTIQFQFICLRKRGVVFTTLEQQAVSTFTLATGEQLIRVNFLEIIDVQANDEYFLRFSRLSGATTAINVSNRGIATLELYRIL